MPTLPGRSVDLVLADPPYLINLASTGSGKLSMADQGNAAHIYAMWITQCRRLLRNTGFGVFFNNWRGLPILMRGAEMAGARLANLIIWDKVQPGTNAKYQLRPRFEVALLWAESKAAVQDRTIGDIFEVSWSGLNLGGGRAARQTDHPAEKPVELYRLLIDALLPGGGHVLDPFAGSGTTGVAARAAGCESTLIEADPQWIPTIERRIGQGVLDL